MAEHELSIGLSSDRYTPPEYFRALGQPWHGLVFMNPPFGSRRGHVPWLRKFFAHGNGIALVAARTSADWFHELVPNAELLLFPNGKSKFHRPDGSIGKEPRTGIVLIGADSSRARRCCAVDSVRATRRRVL